MTTINPATIEPSTHHRPLKRLRNGLIWAGVVVALFVGMYTMAWVRASMLTTRFINDAEASYQSSNYIEALTGYEEFDAQTNEYVTRGGYMQVVAIWADPYAWPHPTGLAHAQTRVDEILGQHLTIADAEVFVQANVGQTNPYLGVVYLRLGELYEEAGEHDAAIEIYTTVAELFPNESTLIVRAQQHLDRLEESHNDTSSLRQYTRYHT
ncbi:MAG: tetratricopeptide repeat protein [Chloroflexota bacterium]